MLKVVIILIAATLLTLSAAPLLKLDDLTPSPPTAIVLVHGLFSGASIWDTMAPQISRQINNKKDSSYIQIGIEQVINPAALCWDAVFGNEEIYCTELANIDGDAKFRSRPVPLTQAEEHIFGLKKGDFDVQNIAWKFNYEDASQALSASMDKKNKFLGNYVFAINFANNNQLSFDAQGVQLKAIIDDISTVTGINDFILIGHSMGGLASRAYIQNEETKNIQKLITLETPHLGGIGAGIYTILSKNAGVNLASDSMDLQQLNTGISAILKGNIIIFVKSNGT